MKTGQSTSQPHGPLKFLYNLAFIHLFNFSSFFTFHPFLAILHLFKFFEHAMHSLISILCICCFLYLGHSSLFLTLCGSSFASQFKPHFFLKAFLESQTGQDVPITYPQGTLYLPTYAIIFLLPKNKIHNICLGHTASP